MERNVLLKKVTSEKTMLTKVHHFFCRPMNYEWYLTLKKPWFVPPAEVISIIWTTLYTMIAFSLYYYLKANGFTFDDGVSYFCVQMLGNALFCVLFFRYKLIHAALADCILLVVFIGLTIHEFHQKDHFAAQLLYPYLAWVTVAVVIMTYIITRN